MIIMYLRQNFKLLRSNNLKDTTVKIPRFLKVLSLQIQIFCGELVNRE